jgi:methylmalonyl-CoA mutase N-terminal domain/subunit
VSDLKYFIARTIIKQRCAWDLWELIMKQCEVSEYNSMQSTQHQQIAISSLVEVLIDHQSFISRKEFFIQHTQAL